MKNSKMVCVACLLVFLMSPAAMAQTTASAADAGPARKLGLKEALQVAVKQNPTLSKHTVDVAIAEARVTESFGMDDLFLDASVNGSRTRNRPVAGVTFQSLESDSLSGSLGITQPLSTGGSLSLRGSASYNKSLARLNVMGVLVDQSSKTKGMSFDLSLLHPLLRGFGKSVARAPQRRAKVGQTIAELQRAGTAANTIRDVIHAYWELSYAGEEIAIREASLKLAQEQLKIVRARVRVGTLAPTAAAEVEASIALREETVLLAVQQVSDRSLVLRTLVGLPIGVGEIDLEPTDKPVTVTNAPDLNKELQAALAQNPELQQARAAGDLAAIEVDVTENGMLPQLDLTASVGPTGTASRFADAFDQVTGFDTVTYSGGLVFSTALQRRGQKGARSAARHNMRRVKMTEVEVQAQISASVVRTVHLVRSAQKRIEVLTKGSRLSSINLKTERARYSVGRATSFDVLLRQDELAQAQLRQVRARVDYLKAVAILEALTGEILPRYGIELAPVE